MGFTGWGRLPAKGCEEERKYEDVAALRKLLPEFAHWIWREAEAERLLLAGQTEMFFDNMQLEVDGKQRKDVCIATVVVVTTLALC